MKKYLLLTLLLLLTINYISLSQSLFFVFLNTNPDKEVLSNEKIEELQKLHLENISKLFSDGKLVAAGPFDGGGGLFILKANSFEDANLLLQTDPAIKANRYNIEVIPMDITSSSLCKIDEPYTMVNYNFLRITPYDPLSVSNNYWFKQLSKKVEHEKDFVFSCLFKNGEGGVIITKIDSNSNENLVSKITSFKVSSNFIITQKNLWIAEGTFCEKYRKESMNIISMTPNLMVSNVNETVEFYQEMLGFELVQSVPDSGKFVWAMMKNNEVLIMFQDIITVLEEFPDLDTSPGKMMNLYIKIENITKLHDFLEERVKIVSPLKKTFYGSIEFTILDINGYYLTFAEEVE